MAGRWTTWPWPWTPSPAARYAFAGGNPISFIELDGHGFFSSIASGIKDVATGVVDHIKEDPLQFVGEVAAGVAVAVAVGAVCSTGVGCVILAGAAAGAASSAYGYSLDVAQGEHGWDWGEFGKDVLIGTAAGAVTAGLAYGAGRAVSAGVGRLRGGAGAVADADAAAAATPHGGAPKPGAAPAKPTPTPAKPAPTPAKPAPAPAKPPASDALRSGNPAGSGGRLPMTMECVCQIANKYGIDISDVKINIDKSKIGYFGSTSPKGTITLTRDAFRNEEQLARTLAHETFHVGQIRSGMGYPQNVF